MTILSRNLTQIMRKDVPSIEDQLQHILPQMEQIQKQIDEMMPSVKEQQQGTLLYTEQMQRLQTFTNIYQKWNDQLLQIHRQLMQYVFYHLDNHQTED
jgi:DNA repair ATPase RecN